VSANGSAQTVFATCEGLSFCIFFLSDMDEFILPNRIFSYFCSLENSRTYPVASPVELKLFWFSRAGLSTFSTSDGRNRARHFTTNLKQL
jgi:hypothetical protein